MSQIEQARPLAGVAWLTPPSYIDRFLRFVQGLPLPYWLTYLLLFLLQSGINHAIFWIESGAWPPPLNGILVIFAFWQWMPMAVMTYLNQTSKSVLNAFRPLLQVSDEGFARLKAEFTTMPPRSVIATGIFWGSVASLGIYLYWDIRSQIGPTPMALYLNFFEMIVCFSTGGVVYYHSLRQLALIHRTVQRVGRFDLFALDPAYAFSRLTARTGIAWVILIGVNFLLFPFQLVRGWMLALTVVMLLFALAAFALPLQVISRQLVREKRALLAQHQRRVETTLARLHQRLEQGDLSEMDALNKALASLDLERRMLDNIPTLPWRTATLTGFLSAAVLPVVLLLIQIILQRWLAR